MIDYVQPDPIDVDAALRRLRADGGYEIVHESPGLEVGVYVLVAPEPDRQQPHADDELYVVLEGSGTLEIEGSTVQLDKGHAAFVPAGAEHRFSGYEQLAVLVIFAKRVVDRCGKTRRQLRGLLPMCAAVSATDTRTMDRLVVAARLKPGMRARAAELVAEGPPVRPSRQRPDQPRRLPVGARGRVRVRRPGRRVPRPSDHQRPGSRRAASAPGRR